MHEQTRAQDQPGAAAIQAGMTTIDATIAQPASGDPGGVVCVSETLATAFGGSRYRPRQLHAHGGLGEVYLADDLELGRAVALKRIRDSRTIQAEDAVRFRREAEITGRLEHPGIVPIYGLGQDAAGRPYYTMRFIEGETLANAIDAFHQAETPDRDVGERSLSFRHLLNRFMAACQAVAFAHSRGVIHRDIKPANIMLGQFGETLLVDWGLARHASSGCRGSGSGDRVSGSERNLPATSTAAGCAKQLETLRTEPDPRPPEPDSRNPTPATSDSATVAGTILGTPAFMSPEQAAGNVDEIGPASDIFSLGATLYYLLTGRPPYKGDLAIEDAMNGRYLSPRRHKSDVPPELEAIVLKAMARKPSDRFASAQDLANDVDKWLGQEPVSVYREPWSKRLGRWVRRHRTLVTTTGVALAVAVIALGVGSIWLNKARRNEEAAKRQAESLAAEVALQRDEAKSHYKLARRAVDDMLTEVSEKLNTTQDVPAVRKQLLQQALEFYQQFLRKRSDDPQVRGETANAFYRAAQIHVLLGEHRRAEEEFGKSIDLWSKLLQDQADQSSHRASLACVQGELGDLFLKLDRYDECEKMYAESRALTQKLLDESPDDPARRYTLSGSLHNMGRIYSLTNRFAESEAAYRRALQIRAQLAHDRPKSSVAQDGHARTLYSLGGLLIGTPKTAEGEKMVQQAADIWRKLAAEYPGNAEHRRMLAASLHDLGSNYGNTTRLDLSAKALGEARLVREKLVADFPTVHDYRVGLAMLLKAIMWLERETAKYPESIETAKRAIAEWERLVADLPDVPSHLANLVETWNEYGWILDQMSRLPEARAAFQQALDRSARLVEKHPENHSYAFARADSLNGLGMIGWQEKRFDDAEKHYREALQIRERIAKATPQDFAVIDSVGGAICNLGNLERDRGHPESAVAWYDRGIELLTPILAKDSRRTITRLYLSNLHWGKARSLAAQDRHAESLKDWDRALELAPSQTKLGIQWGKALSASRVKDEKK